MEVKVASPVATSPSGRATRRLAGSVRATRRGHLTSRTFVATCHSYRQAGRRLGVCARVTRKLDYVARTGDEPILQMPLAKELYAEDIKVIFSCPRNIDDKYEAVERIGAGSFGVVSKVIERETGRTYACKSISKIPKKKDFTNPRYLLKIRNEIDCMNRLGASLDAVFLKDVFEDDTFVHLVMELCSGGHLMQAMDVTALSEEGVADLMRPILRFVAQCHSKNLVYRDVNPVNFLFSDSGPSSSLKATDFGLALEHKPGDPPITTRAGTPVYMAPEVISRSYDRRADIWSAGILCFQLLTGRYPYWDSQRIPPSTTMNELFGIIVSSTIDFDVLHHEPYNLSPEAINFLKGLLERHPSHRFTATEALNQPWIQEGGQNCCSAPLGCTVVQRMQRFAVNGQLKQYVLNLIAEDILNNGDELSVTERLKHVAPLLEFYTTVTTSETGAVTAEDLVVRALSKGSMELVDQGYDVSADELETLMGRLDVKHDGLIDFDEFATALLDWQHFQNRQDWEVHVRSAFNEVDVNSDGFISLDDVIEGLTNPYAPMAERESEARLMLRECDTNEDGQISFEEFYDMLLESPATMSLQCYDRRYADSSCEIGFE